MRMRPQAAKGTPSNSTSVTRSACRAQLPSRALRPAGSGVAQQVPYRRCVSLNAPPPLFQIASKGPALLVRLRRVEKRWPSREPGASGSRGFLRFAALLNRSSTTAWEHQGKTVGLTSW